MVYTKCYIKPCGVSCSLTFNSFAQVAKLRDCPSKPCSNNTGGLSIPGRGPTPPVLRSTSTWCNSKRLASLVAEKTLLLWLIRVSWLRRDDACNPSLNLCVACSRENIAVMSQPTGAIPSRITGTRAARLVPSRSEDYLVLVAFLNYYVMKS